MTKAEMRAQMRSLRRAVTLCARTAASERVCGQLSRIPCRTLAVYLASPEEIDLTALVGACVGRGVCVVAPRWNGEAYDLAELNGCWPGGLVAGPHGIQEPPSDAPMVDMASVDAWIVPGLAFGCDGTRLGYGGGWYDRMLAKARKDARKVGAGYRFQLVDTVPSERHDIRIEEVVTG